MVSVLELRLLHEHKGIPRWHPCKEPASARDIRDVGSIPGSGRSPGYKGMATHFGILAWRIPWTEGPDGLQSMGLQRVGHD